MGDGIVAAQGWVGLRGAAAQDKDIYPGWGRSGVRGQGSVSGQSLACAGPVGAGGWVYAEPATTLSICFIYIYIYIYI
jgi:hypothetical protein